MSCITSLKCCFGGLVINIRSIGVVFDAQHHGSMALEAPADMQCHPIRFALPCLTSRIFSLLGNLQLFQKFFEEPFNQLACEADHCVLLRCFSSIRSSLAASCLAINWLYDCSPASTSTGISHRRSSPGTAICVISTFICCRAFRRLRL